ncbi:MAG TPA: hypothetical protein VOA87_05065, partial [Thermoanaerobaculia bacterium]|nr:hypothetical protein [Thermoanaerobaculia bacterium]
AQAAQATPDDAASQPAPAPTPDVGRVEVEDRTPAPAPEPPRPEPVTVPSGTTINVELTKTVSSNTSNVGDTFRARVSGDVVQNGVVVIPAGSEVAGEVTSAVPAKKIGGRASLGVRFTDLILPTGETVPLQASLLREGESKTRKDAATIGGAAAGGAILGNILNRASRGRGSIIGALIGAAAGAAIAARHPGEEVTLDQGAVVAIQLDRALDLHRRN